MTARWPSGCLFTVARISKPHHAPTRLNASSPVILYQSSQRRGYATTRPKPPPPPQTKQFRRDAAITPKPALPQPDTVKSAFDTIDVDAASDRINPPRSTLPPPLELPTRGQEAAVVYYYHLGRSYGRFYKNGLKAVWYNYKAARLLKRRLQADFNVNPGTADGIQALIKQSVLKRSYFQLLKRNDHDIGKLPLFGLLVLIFGEWLPLIVPFIPSAVPSTCRIPKQEKQMQEANERRRRWALTNGTTEVAVQPLFDGGSANKDSGAGWPAAFDSEYVGSMIGNLQPDQRYQLSCVLGLHKHLWDKLAITPPLLGGAIKKKLMYIAQDDFLLLESENATSDKVSAAARSKPAEVVKHLSPDELRLAVADRGLDVLGRSEQHLREVLASWLDRQTKDNGTGRVMLEALLTRKTDR